MDAGPEWAQVCPQSRGFPHQARWHGANALGHPAHQLSQFREKVRWRGPKLSVTQCSKKPDEWV